MKITQVLVESAQATVAFAFGRFNPAHQGHIAVWRTVEEAGKNWFIGTNPTTIGPNDPLTFKQKSAWMEEIYPPINGHIVAQTNVLTLAAYIFKKLRNNESASIAYVTDETDWAWSGKLLNQYNGVEGAHGYYKFAQITHVPSPRVSSATALRDAARADDKVAFYHASGTDPKLKVAGLSYFDTVKQACEKYPLPVKRAKKVTEMDSQGYTGSRERTSMSTYGSRDKGQVSKGQDVHLGSDSMLDRKELDKKMLDVLNKSFAKTDKKKGVAEGASNIGNKIKALYQKIYDQGDDAIEFMYNDSPIFAQYWDEYEGDVDSIIAEVNPKELQIIYSELESAAEDQGLTEANPNQQFALWHPETKTYKGTKNKIPTSDYAGDNDITTNYRRVDNFKHNEVNPLHKGDDSIEQAERNVNREQLTKLVKAAFNILTPEEKEVLNYRFWHDMTLDSIAQKMSISGPRVRQIEAQAFRKLKRSSNLTPVGESTEQKTVAKTWDKMTPQEKISGVKGRTVWNEKTQRYYTVFDVPVKQTTDEASLATMRDYFAGDENARDPYEITKQRLHFSKDKNVQPNARKEFRSPYEYEQWLKQNKLKQITKVKEDEAGEVEHEEGNQLIPFPAGTAKVHVSDVYDWYKLGQIVSDLDDADPKMFGQGAPQTVIAFGSEEEESKLMPLLKRLGLRIDDIDPEGADLDEAYHAGSLYEMIRKRINK